MEEKDISIEEVVHALKKRWELILTITLGATLIAIIFSFFIIKPQYGASAKIFIGKEQGESEAYSQNDVVMYQKLMKTYAEAIKTKDLVERAIGNVETELTSKEVISGLSVVPVADTQILQIKFKGRNPDEVAKIVTEVTNEFIESSKQLVSNGNVQILESVTVPQKPVSPNKKMNIAIAFFVGLMSSLLLCFLLEYLDRTFKTKEQLEKELDVPVFGVIPNMDEM